MGPENRSGSPALWYVLGALVLAAILAFWYYGQSGTQNPEDNTAAAISAEFEKGADAGAALDQDAAAAEAELGTF